MTERHIFLKEAVSADRDVYDTGSNILQDRLCFFARLES